MNEAAWVSVLFSVGIAFLGVQFSAIDRQLNRLSRLDATIDALLRNSGVEFDPATCVFRDSCCQPSSASGNCPINQKTALSESSSKNRLMM